LTTKVVVYTDQRGWKWVTEAPADIIDERELRHGIRLGPPDLASLVSDGVIDRQSQKQLHNALALAMFYDYDTISGRRREVVELIQNILPEADAKRVLIYLVALYQRALASSETPPEAFYQSEVRSEDAN
jgi:hypothetical protein